MSRIMNFGEMLDGLFHFYETTIARKKNKLWEYNGPDTTSNCILVTSPSVKEQLTKKEFEYRVKSKGEDPIKLLLYAAIQLGIQQGINMCSEKPSRYIECEKFDHMMDEIMVKYIKEAEQNKNV